MTFEVELKIKLHNTDKKLIEQFVSSSSFKGKYEGGFEQTDHYFDTIPPSSAKNDTALRIRIEKSIDLDRKTNKMIEITYKGKKLNPNSKTRLEYNLHLVAETDFKAVKGLFNELGYVDAIQIYKKRHNYLLEPDEGIVLSVDTNELGDFVEIEKIIEKSEEIESTEEYLWNYLQNIIGPLTKDRKIVKSYLELILEAKKGKKI